MLHSGCFIRYDIAVQKEPSVNAPRNTFTVMMTAAIELKFPPKMFSTPETYEIGRGDHCLHDNIIDFLKERMLGSWF